MDFGTILGRSSSGLFIFLGLSDQIGLWFVDLSLELYLWHWLVVILPYLMGSNFI